MPSFVEMQEHEEAVAGTTYRATYRIGGPYPPMWVKVALNSAIRTAARISGRVEITGAGIEFFDKGSLPGGPYNTWSLRITWKKTGTGSPMLLFTGAGGIITLAIVGILVGVTGAVIVARAIERLVEHVPAVAEAFPALILGGVLLAGLYLKGRG